MPSSSVPCELRWEVSTASLVPYRRRNWAASPLPGRFSGFALSPESVEDVYMGCVLSAGLGQAPARQASIGAGIPHSVGAMTVNKVCGSSIQTVIMASHAVALGEAQDRRGRRDGEHDARSLSSRERASGLQAWYIKNWWIASSKTDYGMSTTISIWATAGSCAQVNTN